MSQLEAGRAYYKALGKLGLTPEGLLWAYDVREEQFRLWLVWSGLDRHGPLAMSKLLFKAYRSSALPEEIDPFTVYIVSPEHMIGKLSRTVNFPLPTGDKPFHFRIQNSHEDILHHVEPDWVYHFESKRFNTKKVDREWRSFNENVSSLAA